MTVKPSICKRMKAYHVVFKLLSLPQFEASLHVVDAANVYLKTLGKSTRWRVYHNFSGRKILQHKEMLL